MPIVKIDKKTWENSAQPGELDFHKKCEPRKTGEFRKASDNFLRSIGFTEDDFAGKTILDAGCGSVLRTRFFKDARIYALDPLALEYSEIPWCDIFTADMVIPLPLETYYLALADSADFTFSINVLDHCYDFEKCLENLVLYTKKGGKMFLSFDEHTSTDALHPLVITLEYCYKIFEKYGLEVLKFSEGAIYGSGKRSLHFWLGV